MPVVVNEFEVVPGAPAQTPTGATEGSQEHQQPPPDPTKAEEELARSLRRLETRAARLHAS